MSWSFPTAAAKLTPPAATRTGTSYAVNVTSTSTIKHESAGHPDWLRMYLVGADLAASGYQETVNDADVEAVGLDAATKRTNYLAYIDSDRTTGQFDLNTAGYLPLRSTWLALEKTYTGWPLVLWPPSSLWGTFIADLLVSGTASYKDPCVVEVPAAVGGGWLMLMTRERTVTSSGWTSPGSSKSEQSIGDIVAFYSNNADFRWERPSDRVLGPVVVVHSLRALPDAVLRVWLAVPSAAFVTDDASNDLLLYVYYGVEIPETPYLGGLLAAKPEDAATHQAAVAASPYATLANTGFTAVSRLDWHDLWAAFTARTPEALGELYGLAEPLGRVRVWIPTPGTTPVRAATEFLTRFAATTNKLIDPELEWCEGELSLYFRGVPTPVYGLSVSSDDGHGLWRAAAMPDRVHVRQDDGADPGRFRATVFGVDFVLAPGHPNLSDSPDLAAPAGDAWLPYGYSLAQNPADPDVVETTAGWALFAGGYDLTTAAGAHFPFLARRDGAGTICRSWEYAWAGRA